MKMIKSIPYSVIIMGIIPFLLSCSNKEKDTSRHPNVLFIAVDDLRNQANLFGDSFMHTPNLDCLGKEGVVFTRAYCSVPVCGASRVSLLSGVRPTGKRFLNYYTRKDNDFPNQPSLPKWFKNHGYTTISNGKIYHHPDDDLDAWSETPYVPKTGIGRQGYLTEASKAIIIKNRTSDKTNLVKGPAFECADVEDNAYPDGLLAEKSINDLRKLSKEGKPFFLAVGFWKPHLPFNAPKKYWDLYNPDSIKLAENPYQPINAPDAAMHSWDELRRMYDNIPQQGPMPENDARQLIHGYYACVSYTDAQIGKLLNELDALGLAENTIVVLWGDHGWHLGEHTLWCKHCNFNKVMNAPLMVKAPGKTKGQFTSSITEFIDIYPSLCDLCELPKPEHLDGQSFVPVLNCPSTKVKEAAFVKYHNAESVITERYTYTEFRKDTVGAITDVMLYDLETDPDENVNISDEPISKVLIEKFSNLLSEVKQTKND